MNRHVPRSAADTIAGCRGQAAAAASPQRQASGYGSVWQKPMARYYYPLVALAVVLSLPSCFALVETTSISESGVSATPIADVEFGLAAGGYMNFDVELSGASARWCLCVTWVSRVWAGLLNVKFAVLICRGLLCGRCRCYTGWFVSCHLALLQSAARKILSQNIQSVALSKHVRIFVRFISKKMPRGLLRVRLLFENTPKHLEATGREEKTTHKQPLVRDSTPLQSFEISGETQCYLSRVSYRRVWMCLHDGRSNGVAYIVVVDNSVTADYFTSLTENNLTVDDPPPVCLAPSTGRFEVGRGGDKLKCSYIYMAACAHSCRIVGITTLRHQCLDYLIQR